MKVSAAVDSRTSHSPPFIIVFSAAVLIIYLFKVIVYPLQDFLAEVYVFR